MTTVAQPTESCKHLVDELFGDVATVRDAQHTARYDARREWREAVAAVAEQAKAVLPAETNGRLEKAVALVLADDVKLTGNGHAEVASGSNPDVTYLVNGSCQCRDYEQAPGKLCKHRLAGRIALRAHQRLSASPTQPTTPPAPLPEAPASANVRLMIDGREVQVTLRDRDETALMQRMARLLAQYPAASALVTAAPQSAPQAPVCRWHGDMKPSVKGKGWFCPSKMADGSYCKEHA